MTSPPETGKHSNHAARRRALELLYAADLRGVAIHGLLETERVEPLTKQLVTAVADHRIDLDRRIDEVAKGGWTVRRMAIVDRNILRLALAEVLHSGDVPRSVVMDEAVELAKAYAGDDAPSFINGVLAAALRMDETKDDSTSDTDP